MTNRQIDKEKKERQKKWQKDKKKTKGLKDIQSTWVPSGAGNNRISEGA